MTDGEMTWLREYLEQMEGRINARIDRLEARIVGLEAKIDGLEARIDGLEARIVGLDAKIERVETTLLTEFHKWASPLEMRVRTHAATLRSLDIEQEAMDDRLRKLEGRRDIAS